MEVVCCGSAVGKREVHMLSDPSLTLLLSRWHIISIWQLEESLNATRRVFRASAIVAVRQKHYKTRPYIPLAFSRSNELINHNLSAVCKVTELSLPKYKRRWVGTCVSLLEAKNSILRQVRVRRDEMSRRVVLSDWVYRNVESITILMENVSVSVREGTSFYILTGKSYVVSLVN